MPTVDDLGKTSGLFADKPIATFETFGVEFVEHAHEVAPLPPPARQQGIAVLVQGLGRDLGQIAADGSFFVAT